MEAASPRILRASICIPTRNRAELLRLTLESLDRQTISADRFEVIVGDDGSTDETVAMLGGLRPRYPLTWRRATGSGPGAARNAAAGAAGNDVLIFLDDDQLASPDLVAAHLDAHERSGVVLVQGDYPLADGCDRDGASMVFERSRVRTLGSWRRGALASVHLWGANFSVRQQSWRQVGGFDESLPRSQDLDFGLRIADLGVPLIVELGAVSHHLHRVSTRGYRLQCFSEGRCMVRISRKRGVALETLLNSRLNRPLDRILTRIWTRYPRWADAGGRLLTGLARAADLVEVRPAQVWSSRMLRRFHELGGIALEAASPAPVFPTVSIVDQRS